jgi:hypothetical protein
MCYNDFKGAYTDFDYTEEERVMKNNQRSFLDREILGMPGCSPSPMALPRFRNLWLLGRASR